MIFLINATNLKDGGGLQVAQSIIGQLHRFSEHRFIIVISTYINDTDIAYGENAVVYKYNIRHNVRTILFGRDSFLDGLVLNNHVDTVLTIFGPSLWIPKCKHLCGFARAQLILKDSPFFKTASFKERIMFKIWDWAFRICSKNFYTENSYISELLQKHYKKNKVYTVTNYYNQVFDMPEKWRKDKDLPSFEGITCLSVSSYSTHKNFEIIDGIIRYLRQVHPSFKIRFVLTFDKAEMAFKEDVQNHYLFVGKKDVSEIPVLYEQSDIMFMPTLLECFTATYPEAMRMRKPIVTTDLEFAHGLCGDAACYFSSIDPAAAAEAIYKVATDKEYASRLVQSGEKMLLTYDNYEQRAEKLVKILEEISHK